MHGVIAGPARDRHHLTRGILALVWLWAVPAFAQPPARHLVVPFEQVGSAANVSWLSEASAIVLTDDLIALGSPAITRDDRLRAFERLRVPPVASLSRATVIRLGQVVGASNVVVGTYTLDSDQQLTVNARTIRLDTGRMAPEIVEKGPITDVFGVFGRVARRLVPDSRVTAEQMEQGHPPIAAFEQYVKGLIAEAPETKVAFLTQALRTFPSFQRAKVALWAVHTEVGEHKQALATLRDIPSSHRLSRQGRFLAAVSMLHLGQFKEASDALTALNSESPDPALLNNLGVVQLRRAAAASSPSEPRAVSYFADATKMDVSDSDLYFNLGYAYWFDRDMPAAILALREAVRRNPADDRAHYVLGVVLQAAGNSAEAAREKELARQLSSEYVEWEKKQPGNAVPRGLERIKTDLDVPAALRVDNVIVAAGQRDQRELAAFHLEAGRRAYEAERDAEAIAELRRAVYLSPYDSEAHLLLGRAYLRSGRIIEAIDALRISIWSTDTIAARLVLAEAYLQGREVERAREALQTILKMDPGNAAASAIMQRLP